MGAGRLPFWVDLIYKSAFQKKKFLKVSCLRHITIFIVMHVVVVLCDVQQWLALTGRLLLHHDFRIFEPD